MEQRDSCERAEMDRNPKNWHCMKGMRHCHSPSASGQNKRQVLAAATIGPRPPVGISDTFACEMALEMATVWAFGLRSDDSDCETATIGLWPPVKYRCTAVKWAITGLRPPFAR